MSRLLQPAERVWRIEERTASVDRKHRLFVCACCRELLPLLPDSRSVAAVATAERFADGLATLEALRHAWHEAGKALKLLPLQAGAARLERRAGDRDRALEAARHLARAAWLAALPEALDHRHASVAAEHVCRAWELAGPADSPAGRPDDFLVDIFGLLGDPASLDPAWLAWNDAVAVRIAQHIYDGQRFEALPILADALEEAGCTSGNILDHCRGPGPHVKGCWVVDLVLGLT